MLVEYELLRKTLKTNFIKKIFSVERVDHREQMLWVEFETRNNISSHTVGSPSSEPGHEDKQWRPAYVGVALAVSAVIGTSGKRSRKRPSMRYSSLKS